MMPLQGTGCSDELWGDRLLPKNEVTKLPIPEKKFPSCGEVVVTRVIPGTGPSAGRCDTGTGASSEGRRDTSGGAWSDGGRMETFTGGWSAGTGLTLVAYGTA
jgi:hypothetical protein